ncbi:MAG: VanZ family protein [Bacteroidaceae bacterium]|nr:VanZ family protein [Bacteroidaceae bacterium]
MKRTFRNFFWSILTSVSVFVLSVVPIPEVPQVEDVPLFDKWVHMLMYAFVALAVWFDWYRHREDQRLTFAVFTWAVVYPIMLGGCLELWQAYLTTCRSGEWLDFYADTVGTLIALPVGLWLVRPNARALWKRLCRR